MAFDIRHSSVASWLNVIAALIAIAGLGSEFFPKFFPTLQLPVQVPLWALLATITFSPSLAIFVLRRIHTTVSEPTVKVQSVEVPMSTQVPDTDIEDSKTTIAELKRQLEMYQSLENEILGVLASGEEWNLDNLTGRLNLTHTVDGKQRVRLAVASLVDQRKIGSTGSGALSKLRYVGP